MLTSNDKIDLNFYRHFWIECPPRSRPIWLIAFSLSSNYFTANAGISTPAMFYSDFSSLIVALFTASKTLPLTLNNNILEFSCAVFRLSHLEEGLLAFFTHLLFAFEEFLHDLLEFFFQCIGFSLQQLMALSGGSDFLFVQLHVPGLL